MSEIEKITPTVNTFAEPVNTGFGGFTDPDKTADVVAETQITETKPEAEQPKKKQLSDYFTETDKLIIAADNIDEIIPLLSDTYTPRQIKSNGTAQTASNGSRLSSMQNMIETIVKQGASYQWHKSVSQQEINKIIADIQKQGIQIGFSSSAGRGYFSLQENGETARVPKNETEFFNC